MLRRCALGATVLLVGIALTFAAWRTVSAAGGTVTVGPDLEFHDGASSSSNTTVNAGDAVVFTWSGALPHSVTADDGSFDSGVQTSGTYSFMFSTPGTYRYYCSVHGGAGGIGMSGTITVLAASTPTATATSAAATSTNTPASTPSPTPTVAADRHRRRDGHGIVADCDVDGARDGRSRHGLIDATRDGERGWGAAFRRERQ